MDSSPWRFDTDVLLALAAALYTLVMAFDSVHTGLGHDDLMNLTHAWRPGIHALLRDNVIFYEVGSAHRPLGEVLYWVLFYFFKFDPFPYRVACLALLTVNGALLFWVCRSLDLSRPASALACLVHGYHGGFWPLYYNTGTCYDLLAFLFYMLALGTYVRIRRRGRAGLGGVLAVCALTILGLSSKEMGVTLPAVLAGYELMWLLPIADMRQWVKDAALAWTPVAAIVAAYAAGHFTGARSLSAFSSYDPQLDLPTYWQFLERTFREMFYAFHSPPWVVAAGCAVTVAIATAMRRKGPALGLVLFFAGVVPIAFIAPRSLSAAYIPTAGLAMVYGAGVAAMAERAGRATRPWASYAVCAIAAGCVIWTHLDFKQRASADTMMAEQARDILRIRMRLQELIPDPTPGSRILLLEDPFLQLEDPSLKEWASVFLVELIYEDVHIDQAFRMEPAPSPEAIAGYDYVLTASDARLELVRVQ